MSVPLSMTFMSFDMDQPLNRAHRYERTAEGLLSDEKWDDAEHSYLLAAEMMKKALEGVSSANMAVPLKMQAEKLEKMKDVIGIKRREANCHNKSQEKGNPKSHHSSPKTQNDVVLEHIKTSKKGDFFNPKSYENVVDKGTETSQIPENKPKFSPANTWQLVPRDIMHLIRERETDSLLQFLNFPITSEDDLENPLTSSSLSKRKPKSQEAIIEEYRTRLNLLQTTSIALLRELENKEQENKSLKLEVDELRIDVSGLNERLMVYEDDRNYLPLHFVEDDMATPGEIDLPQNDPMAVSMLIDQPESYFEFERKNIASEIQQATEDDEFMFDKRFKSLPAYKPKPGKTKDLFDQWAPNLGSMDQSVRYEDLDEEPNTEVSETILNSTSNLSSNSSGSLQLHYASIAGLPPLSSVHFELEEKDNVVTDFNRGGFIRKLS